MGKLRQLLNWTPSPGGTRERSPVRKYSDEGQLAQAQAEYLRQTAEGQTVTTEPGYRQEQPAHQPTWLGQRAAENQREVEVRAADERFRCSCSYNRPGVISSHHAQDCDFYCPRFWWGFHDMSPHHTSECGPACQARWSE
jgi:hypothetical protein